MAEQQPNDLQRARREACELLGFGDDAERLCASDRLRGDLVVSLRLAIDDASASLIDGNSTDLARLINAMRRRRSFARHRRRRRRVAATETFLNACRSAAFETLPGPIHQ
jgi:hypothetical protein